LIIDSIYLTHNELRTDLSPNISASIRGKGTLFPLELVVETSKGSDNGFSTCSYQSGNDFITFFDTKSNIHKQKINLITGDYDVPISCVDPAGNTATGNAKFNLNIDGQSPIVTRVYYQSGKLNLITNEEAKCYVSFSDVKQCGFDIEGSDVESMSSIFTTGHSTTWKQDETYYIKCQDLFDNQNSQCAIKVNPSFV